MEREIEKLYQIALLGNVGKYEKWLKLDLKDKFKDLDIDFDLVQFLLSNQISEVDQNFPTVGVYFTGNHPNPDDSAFLQKLVDESSVIVPCAPSVKGVSALMPESIRGINALAIGTTESFISRLTNTILEGFQLLRAQRRLFISYKRSDTEGVAIQLYEALDSQGFDVFLDSRSVKESADFQEVLWHRLVDSDLVMLLDSPRFWESYWTDWEYAKANASRVEILRILWPNVIADLTRSMGGHVMLKSKDFACPGHKHSRSKLVPSAIVEITNKVESLRAAALSQRHKYIVDSFCDAAVRHGASANLQPQRYISVNFNDKRKIAVVPALGVPTSDLIQDIEEAVVADEYCSVWLLYDDTGVRDRWCGHMKWLSDQVRVKTISLINSEDFIKEQAKC